MDYAVTLHGKQVGKAQTEKQGLYYRVVCRCNISGEVMYRLQCSAGNKSTNLGILVPTENGFGLDTRFPVSRLGDGVLTFSLLPRHESMEERTFVPIRPEEPFRYMEQLKDAFLQTQQGQQGASLVLQPEEAVIQSEEVPGQEPDLPAAPVEAENTP